MDRHAVIGAARHEQATPPATPTQLAFIDAPAEPPAVRLAVMGVLHQRPEVRLATDGSVHLFVKLQQPGDSLPFVALQHTPPTERLHVEQLAASLHLGSVVLLRGQGLVLNHRHGELALELQRCDSVSEIAFDSAQQSTHHHATR